jgi:hypothetical protein
LRYRLFDSVEGRELGWFVSERDDWRPGDLIGSAERPGRVVLAVHEPEGEAEFHAYLVVGAVGEVDDSPEAVAS